MSKYITTNIPCDCVTSGKLPTFSEPHFHHLWSEYDNPISPSGLLLKSIEIVHAEYLAVPHCGFITPSIGSAPPAPPSMLIVFLEYSALVAPWRASTGIQLAEGVICPAACPRACVLMKIPIVMHNQEESRAKLLWEPVWLTFQLFMEPLPYHFLF